MDSGTHPLLIDLVLTKIFQDLGLSDLKRCRLVCHLWSRTSHVILFSKSRHAIIFGDPTTNKKQNLQTFSSTLKSGISLPFTKFTLQPSLFSNQRSQTIQDFFVTTGPCFKSLTIIYLDHSHYYTLPKTDFLTDQFLAFSNLKHLRFEVLPYDQFGSVLSAKSSLDGVDLFKSIFKGAFKDLVRLELVIPQCTALVVNPYLNVLCDSSGASCNFHSKFTELVLNISLSSESIRILQRARQFQFKMIRISQKGLSSSEEESSLLYDFIQNHANSLQHLKTDCINLPCLPVLQILEILENNNSSPRLQPTRTVNFSKIFPSLRKIIFLSYIWHDSYLNLLPIGQIFRTVRELKLPKQIQSTTLNLLVSTISASFPMLAHLEIFLSHENVHYLSDIFMELLQLEKLFVTFLNWKRDGNECIDHILTGLPKIVCHEIYSFGDDLPNVNNFRMYPSILDLKKLKSLQLRNMTKYGINRPKITDISIHHGLILHPTLNKLCIWPSEMSREGTHELRARLKQLVLMSF